mmetsp:Transcript_10015/g.31373  ORF Transcript_10015/g.31373 Transcript_10015/m.31373 type:complete len:221 (-) Transcript_10015:624-1286(-)
MKPAVRNLLRRVVQRLSPSRSPCARAGPRHPAWNQPCPPSRRTPAPQPPGRAPWREAEVLLCRRLQRVERRRREAAPRPSHRTSTWQRPPLGPRQCGRGGSPERALRHRSRPGSSRRGSRCKTSGTGSCQRGSPLAAPAVRGGSAAPPLRPGARSAPGQCGPRRGWRTAPGPPGRPRTTPAECRPPSRPSTPRHPQALIAGRAPQLRRRVSCGRPRVSGC